MDALGLPVHFTITPGQWGDPQQAQGLVEELSVVSHVLAVFAYVAEYLCEFDLPLNFYPAATGARLLFTPIGAGWAIVARQLT